MQHRFAYVGSDLQDLYGIDPAGIGAATTLSDAYFGNGSAAATLATLARHAGWRAGFRGDRERFPVPSRRPINLRLQNAADHSITSSRFTSPASSASFRPRPKNSFLVANADYVARRTGADIAEIVLLRSSGDPAALAERARAIVASLPGVRVADIGTTQRGISSSLTAVDLRGLTRLELGFAVLLVAGATGLVLALGLAERRRAFAILAVLGAKRAQLGAFVWSEGLVILCGGAAIGIALGFGVAQMLTTVLTGVFDPPPEALAVPWLYLLALLLAGAVSTTGAVLGTLAAAQHSSTETLREL